jgi:hypothetical protein
MTQISFRAEIDEYTNRVLGVIKEKYGLKTKSEALNVFALQYGEEYVGREIKEELIKEIRQIEANWKKNPGKPMTLAELDKLTGVKNVRIRDKRQIKR